MEAIQFFQFSGNVGEFAGYSNSNQFDERPLGDEHSTDGLGFSLVQNKEGLHEFPSLEEILVEQLLRRLALEVSVGNGQQKVHSKEGSKSHESNKEYGCPMIH